MLGNEGNEESHQGWEPYYHQGGAQCKGHHIHKWPWEGHENPQYVGQGPNLTSWRGQESTKPRALGRYLLNGACRSYSVAVYPVASPTAHFNLGVKKLPVHL